ncbi:MAG: type IV pilus assembly protein PilM [Nitrospirae bacterium]|nr:MAG: type IV pilus assembly protein PilM [Nitrospirota bacterium]
MLFGSKAPIGLDIGTGLIKLCRMEEKGGTYELTAFDMIPLAPEVIVDGVVMDSLRLIDAIKEILRKTKVKAKDVCFAISGHSAVIVKVITMPEMTEEEIEESIGFEAEQYIPFDISDVSIDFQVLGPKEEPGQLDVLLVAAKNDVLNEYVVVLKEAGLNPVVVDVDHFALQNIYEVNYEVEPDRMIALADVGASSIKINIVRAGASIFARDIPTGLNSTIETLQREFDLPYEVADRLLRGEAVEGVEEDTAAGVITDSFNELVTEIERSIDYFRGSMTPGLGEITEVVLAGGGALLPQFVELVRNAVGIDVNVIDPFKNVKISKKLDEDYIRELGPLAAVSMGLAIRRIGDK